jgi:CheY-like chemotaxis protein
MPRHDGTAVLEKLSDSASAPPVVVVTGYPEEMDDVGARTKKGLVVQTLLKPVDVDDVISAAERHCTHV